MGLYGWMRGTQEQKCAALLKRFTLEIEQGCREFIAIVEFSYRGRVSTDDKIMVRLLAMWLMPY